MIEVGVSLMSRDLRHLTILALSRLFCHLRRLLRLRSLGVPEGWPEINCHRPSSPSALTVNRAAAVPLVLS
jgi:hypothetical protein